MLEHDASRSARRIQQQLSGRLTLLAGVALHCRQLVGLGLSDPVDACDGEFAAERDSSCVGLIDRSESQKVARTPPR